MKVALSSIASFAKRHYITSACFAAFGAGCFCAGLYLNSQMALASIEQLTAAVKQQVMASR